MDSQPEIKKYIQESLEKQTFMENFEDLRPDLFFPESWNDTQRAEAAGIVKPQRMKSGILAAIPMRCMAEKCPYASICPLMEQNLAPKNKPCPIEMSMVKVFFDAYVEELDVDTSKMIEVSMIRDLVNNEIQQNRATWLLSLEHFIQENVIGVSDNGEPIYRKELNFAVDYEDRIYKRKERLRSALLATRQARAQAGQGILDNAQVMANLIEEIKKKEILENKALLKRLNIDDSYDEFIDGDPEDNADYDDAEIVDEDK